MLDEFEIDLVLIKNDFSIKQEARAMKKDDLYFFALEVLTILFAIALLSLSIFVNKAIYQMWHERLEHLRQQNVLQLASQETFNLIKSILENACVSCARDVSKFKSHNHFIALD